MNIFFDHQAFSLQNYGGISRYFCELITGIGNTNEFNAHLSLLWSNNVHLSEYNLTTSRYPFPRRSRFLKKSNQLYNSLDYGIRQCDIYHATYFDDFLSKSVGSTPFVATFYDMTYELLSHRFIELAGDSLIISQKKKIALRASHLIAISESTKQDMIELLGIPPEKITVIHLGSSFTPRIVTGSTTREADKRPYILYVGNRSSYKNFVPFLKAIAHLLIKYQVMLVCAGGGDITAEEQSIIKTLDVAGLVQHKVINDAILPELYRGAVAFVFPSLYEGFGIPILEAFSCDCPCVISDCSSLPEVAGDAALYVNPYDSGSMEQAIDRIINDTALRADLIQRGQQRLKVFSWEGTVRRTVELYKQIV